VPGLVFVAMFASQLLPSLAEDTLPSALPKDRYAALRARSPFALATVAVATPAPQASFAANWYVSGVARLGDDYFVTIKGRDLSAEFTLFANEAVDGVTLASVNWSDQVGKSTVILKKGTETARLEFNEAQLRAPAAATAGGNHLPAVRPPVVAATMHPQNPRAAGVNMAAAVPNAPGLNGGAPLRRRSLPIPVPR